MRLKLLLMGCIRRRQALQ